MTAGARQALIELWRVAEQYGAGKKISVRMVARWARELGHRFREDEARQLLAKFAGRDPKQTDASGRKIQAPGTQSDAVGRSADATSRARSKVLLVTNIESTSSTLFGADDGEQPANKKSSKTRNLAAYEAVTLIWNELEPQLSVPIAKTSWRSRNIAAAEKLVASLGCAQAVLDAWRASSAFHGEASVTLARVVDDVNFGRVGPPKEKTALARGFQEPENFKPEVFEL